MYEIIKKFLNVFLETDCYQIRKEFLSNMISWLAGKPSKQEFLKKKRFAEEQATFYYTNSLDGYYEIVCTDQHF